MKKYGIILVVIMMSIMIIGCEKKNSGKEEIVEKEEKTEEPMEVEESNDSLFFVDALGREYETSIIDSVEKHSYDWQYLDRSKDYYTYEDDHYKSRLGIDVSYHQGDIQWKKVKKAGVEFAFVRIGYRGYGEAGSLNVDENAITNIKKATEAGIDVGCYFFSQAINEKEAKEEAKFVLKKLEDVKLQLPIVFDPEEIRDKTARTDHVTGEQFTKNAIAFCEEIEKGGYTPMIYTNMLWEADVLDLTKLEKWDIWYADYEEQPQTPYEFSVWQYSEKGHVKGIKTETDLNIQFVKK